MRLGLAFAAILLVGFSVLASGAEEGAVAPVVAKAADERVSWEGETFVFRSSGNTVRIVADEAGGVEATVRYALPERMDLKSSAGKYRLSQAAKLLVSEALLNYWEGLGESRSLSGLRCRGTEWEGRWQVTRWVVPAPPKPAKGE